MANRAVEKCMCGFSRRVHYGENDDMCTLPDDGRRFTTITPATPAEAALRKLLADVQEARDWWRDPSGKSIPLLLRNEDDVCDYLERLAREGLGEP